MPLEQRVIQPIYVSRGCFNNHDQQPQTNVPNELECVTNGTLGNIIRQLSSLSRHAENLFGCLLDDLDLMMQRSAALNLRIETLTHYVEDLDASNDSLLNDPYQRNNNRLHKTIGVDQFDQQVVARATIPDSLREVYERCDPPPALDKLNPFRDDNINGLKLYTNPNYFFELWRKEMLKDKSTKSSKVAKNKQGDIHSSGGKTAKRNRQQLIHQTSSDSASTYSQQLPPPPPPMPNNQQYPNIQQQHYHQGYYSQQPSQSNVLPQQMEILTAKMNQTTGPYTVIEGSYIDPNNYQHHYVQHQYNKNLPCQNGSSNISIPLSYQQQQSRPNSLELQQQNNYYNNYNNNQSGGGYTNVNNQRISNQYVGSATSTTYQQAQQTQHTPPQNSPSTTMTPTRRLSGAQVSRPSAPPPAPPSTGNSAPSSQPGTPSHKKTTIINGQEVEMREQMNGARMTSRDSLPPPPPPPPNVQMSNGLNSAADMHDVNDSALPPPPPPPPPTFNGSNSNFTSIPTPPPPPNENGSISNNLNANNVQYKSHTTAIPTVEELKSVVLKKIDSSTAQHNDHQSKDIRSNLLAAIRHGIKLRRVEESRQREVEQNAPLHDVASILARRVAMELSDSEGDGVNGDDGNDSDAWDDESEC